MSKSFDKSLRQIEEPRLLFAKVNNTQNMSRNELFVAIERWSNEFQYSFNIIKLYIYLKMEQKKFKTSIMPVFHLRCVWILQTFIMSENSLVYTWVLWLTRYIGCGWKMSFRLYEIIYFTMQYIQYKLQNAQLLRSGMI